MSRANPRGLRRLHLPDLSPGLHTLQGEEAHHAVRVLRVKADQQVELFDGQGNGAEARILEVDRGAGDLRLEVGEVHPHPNPQPEVWAVLCAPKGERADWAVEKLTEVGVARISWLTSERSVAEPSEQKLQRHRRIAQNAARQCGRYHLPSIESARPLEHIFDLPFGGQRLITDFQGQSAPNVPTAPPQFQILVGPEGGFTPQELEKARERGYASLRLNHWILRVETAALVAVSSLVER